MSRKWGDLYEKIEEIKKFININANDEMTVLITFSMCIFLTKSSCQVHNPKLSLS